MIITPKSQINNNEKLQNRGIFVYLISMKIKSIKKCVSCLANSYFYENQISVPFEILLN